MQTLCTAKCTAPRYICMDFTRLTIKTPAICTAPRYICEYFHDETNPRKIRAAARILKWKKSEIARAAGYTKTISRQRASSQLCVLFYRISIKDFFKMNVCPGILYYFYRILVADLIKSILIPLFQFHFFRNYNGCDSALCLLECI